MDDEDSNRSAGASAFASGFSLGGRQFVAQRTDRSTSASFSRSPSNIRSSSARLASLAFINGPQRARDDDRQFARSPVSPSIHSSSPSGLTRSLAAAAAANRSDSGSSASGSPKSEATLTVDDARPADPVRPRAPVQLGKSADGPSVVVRPIVESTEATPLLAQLSGESTGRKRWTDTLRQRWHGKAFSWRAARDAPRRVGAVLPSVFLGTLLNILDGSSYGALLFPAAPIFASSSVLGLSMFFVTTIIAQIVYTSRSTFRAVNGSMMIENLPFLHSIIFQITAHVGEDRPERVFATCLVAIALSSIATGLVFGLLGVLRLGSLLSFFPRVTLVGCIGGIGAFLIISGLQVTARLDEVDNEGPISEVLRSMMASAILPLWLVPIGLAITIRTLTHYVHNPLVFPLFFVALPIIFWSVVKIIGIDSAALREHGWLFDIAGEDTRFVLFDFRNTDLGALAASLPTQLSLVFFAILHVPLNVPALALSVGEENLDGDHELVNHGLSNVLAGLAGAPANYQCYVNSVLFYRSGGDSRLASSLLAVATFLVMAFGISLISYLPIAVVGTLIHVLGFDLLKEAVYDTYGRVSRFEYASILAIIGVMTLYDFTAGIFVGIILACGSFVVTSSRRRAIRSVLSGSIARSTVRRHPEQTQYLRAVGSQTRVVRLQGFVFFGTVAACEATIRSLLDAAQWTEKPIRSLVLDFSLANSCDYSAAEAFLRLQRLCASKGVVLLICGCTPDSTIGSALRSVNLWDNDERRIEVFSTLNDALEHCENLLLRSLWSRDLKPAEAEFSNGSAFGPLLSKTDNLASVVGSPSSDVAHSPRRRHLLEAARELVVPASGKLAVPRESAGRNLAQPLSLLLQALGPYAGDLVEEPQAFFHRLAPYWTQLHLASGRALWVKDDPADSLYVVEQGILRAAMSFGDIAEGGSAWTEALMPASLVGESTFLSGVPRLADMRAERDTVLWRLTVEAHERFEEEQGFKAARQLRKILLRSANESQALVLGHLVSTL